MRNGTKYDLAGCEGCKFLAKEPAWCNYSDITGRTRLAQGVTLLPNGGCVLKASGDTPKPKTQLPRYGYRKEKTYSEKRRDAISETIMALYELGYSDRRIGQEVGKTKKSIQAWRKRRLLPPNCAPGSGKRIPRGKS